MSDYIYSIAKGVLHKADCRYVKRMDSHNRYGTSNMFLIRKNGYQFCKCCGLAAVINNYVDVRAEEMDECVSFMKSNNIDAEYLIRFFRYYRGTMRYSHGVIYMHLNQDQWILDATHGGLVLLHNNYHYNRQSKSREFTGGFHTQYVCGDGVQDAINTAALYRFRPGMHDKNPEERCCTIA